MSAWLSEGIGGFRAVLTLGDFFIQGSPFFQLTGWLRSVRGEQRCWPRAKELKALEQRFDARLALLCVHSLVEPGN